MTFHLIKSPLYPHPPRTGGGGWGLTLIGALQAADDGMPSVTYPRATWRLQSEQEAVPLYEEEKTELLVF